MKKNKLKDTVTIEELEVTDNKSIEEDYIKSENWARVTFFRGKEKLIKEENI